VAASHYRRRRRGRPPTLVQLEVSVRRRVHRFRRSGQHTRLFGHMSGQAATERHQLLSPVPGHRRPAGVPVRHAARRYTGFLR